MHTLAEIFAELREEGKEETAKDIAKKLIQGNFSNEQIANLTKLKLEEVVMLRKSLQTQCKERNWLVAGFVLYREREMCC